MSQIVKILSLEHVTHDVLKISTQKPLGLNYKPGQAVDVSINQSGWEEKMRAFTFTSLPTDEGLEFVIKTYPSHKGVTKQLSTLKVDDELIIQDPFGDISYKGEGIFIAGGAGITPFISIFRQLEKEKLVGNNKLIFANKTEADIIHLAQFKNLLGDHFINILSDEKNTAYEHGFITVELIKKHISNATNYFYICGPEPMMDAVGKQLSSLGIADEYIVKEAF